MIIEGKMSEILQIFKDNLPLKPYCSDDFSRGLDVCYRDSALKRKYIQPNRPDRIQWIIADGDYKNAGYAWQPGSTFRANPNMLQNRGEVLDRRNVSDEIPVPNFICINPINKHAQLFYLLNTPVKTKVDETYSYRAMEYFRRVKDGLNYHLFGDPAYKGNTCKNPFSDEWETITFHDNAYSFEELLLPLPSDTATSQTGATETFLSVDEDFRNSSIFDCARIWAYRNIRRFSSSEDFYNALWNKVESLNGELVNSKDGPMTDAHVKSITRSIYKFCITRFGAGEYYNAFVAKQKARNLISQVVRKRKAASKISSILALAKAHPGASASDIATISGYSLSTVYRALRSKSEGDSKENTTKEHNRTFSPANPSFSAGLGVCHLPNQITEASITKKSLVDLPLAPYTKGSGDLLFDKPEVEGGFVPEALVYPSNNRVGGRPEGAESEEAKPP